VSDPWFFLLVASHHALDFPQALEAKQQLLIARVMVEVDSSVTTKNTWNAWQSTKKCHPDICEHGHE
jgi:hypothetical protein